MNQSIRHWKEHYQEGAPVAFMKTITVQGQVYPANTLVPESLIKLLGKHRLKLWWEARFIRNAKPEELQTTEKPKKTPKATKKPTTQA